MVSLSSSEAAEKPEGPPSISTGTQLRTYRTAVAATGEYTDLIKAGVLDPAKVTRSALQNAARCMRQPSFGGSNFFAISHAINFTGRWTG